MTTSAGSLAALTPDVSTILTAIGAVALVFIGVELALYAHSVIQSIYYERFYYDDSDQ